MADKVMLLPVHRQKINQVLAEFKAGKLMAHGKTVTNIRQALAIAYHEAGISRNQDDEPPEAA